jgi:hypothetical protein
MIANCSLKAIKGTHIPISWNRDHLYILRTYFMIYCFFRFTVKVTILFSTCCGNPLYGPEVYRKIRQIRETGFTSRNRKNRSF